MEHTKIRLLNEDSHFPVFLCRSSVTPGKQTIQRKQKKKERKKPYCNKLWQLTLTRGYLYPVEKALPGNLEAWSPHLKKVHNHNRTLFSLYYPINSSGPQRNVQKYLKMPPSLTWTMKTEKCFPTDY